MFPSVIAMNITNCPQKCILDLVLSTVYPRLLNSNHYQWTVFTEIADVSCYSTTKEWISTQVFTETGPTPTLLHLQLLSSKSQCTHVLRIIMTSSHQFAIALFGLFFSATNNLHIFLSNTFSYAWKPQI